MFIFNIIIFILNKYSYITYNDIITILLLTFKNLSEKYTYNKCIL